MNRRRLDGFLFVGPFLLIYAVILIYPLLLGIGISFHRADLFGARRIFGAGWAILAVGSLAAGLATDPTTELVGRAVQGAGSALIGEFV